VGVVPWIPLMDFDGPSEDLLEQCAEKIEHEAHPQEKADLLTVAQVLAGLKFPEPLLNQFFGGNQTMFESPVLQRLLAMRFHEVILDLLKDRFGTIPQDVRKLLGDIINEKKLRKLILFASKCSDLEAFREKLLS
jgi:hypothetical protein